MKRLKKARFSTRNLRLSRISLYIFHLGLPLIILCLFSFLCALLSTPDIPGYVLYHIHKATLEYIVMSGTIIIVGGFCFDMLQKAEDSKK